MCCRLSEACEQRIEAGGNSERGAESPLDAGERGGDTGERVPTGRVENHRSERDDQHIPCIDRDVTEDAHRDERGGEQLSRCDRHGSAQHGVDEPCELGHPHPNMATRTTPSGGKFVNVATIVAMKAVKDSPASRLRISRGLPLRGSISVKLTPDSRLLTIHASTIRARNKTAGSGRRFPTRSTTSRVRESQPRACMF